MLNNDNAESRKMIDVCYKQRKTTLNPIIDWTDDEVWEFLRKYNIPYCSLYDKGFKRLGCVGCPNGNQAKDFERFPKYKELYIKAFDHMVENTRRKGLKPFWSNGEDVMRWWMQSTDKEIEQTQITELME